MSIFKAIFFVFLTALSFTGITALNLRYYAIESSVAAGTTNPMDKATRSPVDERTDETPRRSLVIDSVDLVNATDLDEVDKRGISEGST